jgi:uncharacterized Ntn-hydrolase superfamily protein
MRLGTYSIVGRDAHTGELGVAVQSHWFSVGSVVAWASPGVGAAATQSIAEVAHGPNALERLRRGLDPAAAITAVLAGDELAPYRQLGLLDASGSVAAHTGDRCIAHAGDVQGEGFSCQANMMARPGVPEAMARAFSEGEGDLAERLLRALEGAEAAGGDVRGRQSAALLVVPGDGEPWRVRFDLRVDDNPDPLAELRRLARLARAYEMAARADELLAAGAQAEAAELYARAAEHAPEADELVFWAGLGVAGRDREEGVALVRSAIAVNASWRTLLERLPAELAPTAADVLAAIPRPAR